MQSISKIDKLHKSCGNTAAQKLQKRSFSAGANTVGFCAQLLNSLRKSCRKTCVSAAFTQVCGKAAYLQSCGKAAYPQVYGKVAEKLCFCRAAEKLHL